MSKADEFRRVSTNNQAKTLILTVGLPYSGKSTWARATGFPIVSPDSIRLALHGQRFYAAAEPFVWAMAYAMAEALFLAGHDNVVVDATNVTAERRKNWESKFDRVEQKIFYVSAATCRARAAAVNDHEILAVIDRMAAEWDLPEPL